MKYLNEIFSFSLSVLARELIDWNTDNVFDDSTDSNDDYNDHIFHCQLFVWHYASFRDRCIIFFKGLEHFIVLRNMIRVWEILQ